MDRVPDKSIAESADDDWRTRFPRRSIHLDFHTGPDIPNVGADFDGDAFARTFRQAHVDSVTLFAKCHHGHLYYDTDRPERHPGLAAGLNLLGLQVEALHGASIRSPIYLSVLWDEYAANHHPEWLALTPELKQVRRPLVDAYQAAWQVMDMSSPYQDYMAQQIEEVLDRFGPVDGIFLDICYDQVSASRWAIEGMRRAELDPTSPEDREKYARSVAHGYMERFSNLIEPALVKESQTGVWFNARPKAGLWAEQRFLRHAEVEALPTGGWGYNYLPYVARFVRAVGLPALGMTGRFHRSWGDMASLKPNAALKYECSQILMHGLTISVGDLLAPNAVPKASVYGLIGSVYEHIEACEPFVAGGEHLADIALLVDPELGDDPGPGVIGAVRLLQQLRQQFDILPFNGHFDDYGLVVIPGTTPVSRELAARLAAYVGRGGALVLSASRPPGPGEKELLAALGVQWERVSEFSTPFLGLAGNDLIVPPLDVDIRVAGESSLLTALEGTEVLVEMVEPYFERTYEHFSGHSYTPPARRSGHGAVLRHGRAIIMAMPLFEAIANDGDVEYRQVLKACIDQLLPAPLLRCDGPVHLETSVLQTSQHVAVHVLSYVPSRLGADIDLVLDPFPVFDVEVSLRLDKRPSAVHQQPSGQALEWSYRDGYATTTVNVIDGHAIIVFECVP